MAVSAWAGCRTSKPIHRASTRLGDAGLRWARDRGSRRASHHSTPRAYKDPVIPAADSLLGRASLRQRTRVRRVSVSRSLFWKLASLAATAVAWRRRWCQLAPLTVASGSSLVASQTCVRCPSSRSSGALGPPFGSAPSLGRRRCCGRRAIDGQLRTKGL